MTSKESGKVRYAYGVAMALLLGGTAFSLATGQAGAQVAQNAPAALAPRPGAPMSFADLVARLQPAVVNISTKQRVPVRAQRDPFEEFFRRFDPTAIRRAAAVAAAVRRRRRAARTRETGSLGSGFIISPDGYVVTNNHLIQQRQRQGHGRHRHRHHHRPQGISGADRRPRRDLRPCIAQDRRPQPAVCAAGATAPSRGSATGSWRSAIPMALAAPSPRASSPRFIAGSPGSAPTTATSRPTPASTWAIRAARCSISTAMSSASIRR